MFLPQAPSNLARQLKGIPLFWIGVSGAIGGGVFVLIGQGAALVGPWVPLAFIVAGVMVMGSALLYSELAASLPAPGGSSAFFINSFGYGLIAFLVAWIALAGLFGLAALNSIAFGVYLSALGLPLSPLVWGLIVLAGAFGLVRRGITGVVRLAVVLGVSLTALFLLYSWLGLRLIEKTGSETVLAGGNLPNAAAFLTAVALVYAAFVGYEGMLAFSGQVKNPGRTLPRSLIGTAIFITILFAVLAYVAVIIAGSGSLAAAPAPLLTAARPLGVMMTALVFAGAVLATISSLVASLAAASYGTQAIAEEGLFPVFLSKKNSQGTAVRALTFAVIIVAGLVLTGSVRLIASLEGAAFLLELAAAALAIFALRQRRPFLRRPFRVPLGRAIPLTVGGAALLFLGLLGPRVHFVLLGWLILGTYLYLTRFIEGKRLRVALGGMAVFLILVVMAAMLAFLPRP